MDTCKTIFFLFTIFVTTVSTFELCSNSFCRPGEPMIRFPFQLQSFQTKSCGYPGFNLFCDAFNQTVVELPGSGKFTVQAIDYHMQHIWLNDPENCLPKRLLDLNLSGSPFTGFSIKISHCLIARGENYTVLATSSERAFRFLESKCTLISTVAVPVQTTFLEPVVTSDLSDDIRLMWAAPRCGRCGLKSNSSSKIECGYIHGGGILLLRFIIRVILIIGLVVSRRRNNLVKPKKMA